MATTAEKSSETIEPGKRKATYDAHLNRQTIESPVFRTDSANAKRFIDADSDRLRFCPSWGAWLVWDGRRWKLDKGTVLARRFAMRWASRLWMEYGACRMLLTQRDASQVEAFCKASNSSAGINAMLTLAQSDKRVTVEHSELDCHPRLFNVLNGTLNLETGQFGDHNPSHKITQLAPVRYDPKATCPQWTSTLDFIFGTDPEMVRYFQVMLGYCLSGDVGEHFLAIWHGFGCNGKSTVSDVMMGILGDDYAIPAADSVLLGDKDTHPTDVADLFRKRFVILSEPEQGSILRESKVKRLTGDGVLQARRMKEDFWRFERTHKTFMATNHKPKIVGVDDGIWRRVKLIPFSQDLRKVTTEKKDFAKVLLREEASGILNWLLDGWRRYQQFGLVDPLMVQVATKDYKGDSDPMGEWLADFCVICPDEELPAKDGFESFSKWQIDTKVLEKYRWTQTKFGRELAERFKKTIPTTGPHRKKTTYQGIRLQTASEKAEETEEKTEVKDDLPTVANSSGVSALEHAFLGGNGSTVGNRGQSGVLPSLEEINASLNCDANEELF